MRLRATRPILPTALLVLIALIGGALAIIPPATAQSSLNLPLDLVVIVDNSGSMTEPDYGESDPRGLRYDATSMLIDLVNDDDRIGLVHFATRANNMLGELRRVGDDRAQLQDAVQLMATSDLQTDEDRLYTNYAPALSTSLSLLASSKEENRKQAVIFLTDGAPSDLNDAPKLNTVLGDFEAAGIPVYLLMLRPRLDSIKDSGVRARTNTTIANVLSLFRDEQRPVIEISSPADIARAFASVLTQLQPGTYLDTLAGSSGSSGSDLAIFSVRAITPQRLSRATFVFFANSTAPAFSVINDASPVEAKPTLSQKPGKYAVFASESSGGSLSGEWSFTARVKPEQVSAFAFLRSELRMQLRYPNVAAAPVGMIPSQKLLIGAAVDGLAADQADEVRLRVNPERCPEARREQPSDRPIQQMQSVGLSETGSPIFWNTTQAEDKELYVTVEYAPANALALWRCYPITAVKETLAPLTIEAAPNNLDAAGTFPIRATLPPNITWVASAYLLSPDGQVTKSDLDSNGRGVSPQVTLGGTYIVRVVAEGVVAGRSVALFGEQTQLIEGTISLETTDIDLGVIKQLGQSLNGIIRLNAPLLTNTSDIRFAADKAQLIGPDGASIDVSAIQLNLCSGGASLTNGTVTCEVEITPPNNLARGSYQIRVPVEVENQRILFDFLVLHFERPESGLSLNLPADGFTYPDPITRAQPILTTTVVAERILFNDQLQIQESLEVIALRDEKQMRNLPPSQVTLRLLPASGVESGRYLLSLEPDYSLPVGQYEVRARLVNPPVPVTPSEIVLRFNKPSVQVVLSPESGRNINTAGLPIYRLEPIWGVVSLPFWRPQSVLAMTSEVLYDTNFPTAFPPPTINRVVKLDDPEQDISEETFAPYWRDDGAVPERTGVYNRILELELGRSLAFASGEYEVSLLTDPSLVQRPRDVTVRVRVYGIGELFWWRIVPGLLVIGLLASLGNYSYVSMKRGFRGDLKIGEHTFVLKGTDPLEIVYHHNIGSFAVQSVASGEAVENITQVATIESLNLRSIRLTANERPDEPITLFIDIPHTLESGDTLMYISHRQSRRATPEKD